MATTVNNAFNEFLINTVNLDAERTKKARTSRDNLVDNIFNLGQNEYFFSINQNRCLNFGSFARRTKLRPLDDIDIMICIAASDDRKYNHKGNGVYSMTANGWDIKNKLNTIGSDELNSIKVVNKFVTELSKLHDYYKAEMHRNKEAATLKLKSYEWNFDIVPCFYCSGDFYLIPDGKGNWKKTDPRIDQNRVTSINQQHNGNLLNLIRLIKFWNKNNYTITISSYLLENMILNRYADLLPSDSWWIDLQFRDTLEYLKSAIYSSVMDPKGIEGDLNTLEFSEMNKLYLALNKASEKASEAIHYECSEKNQKKAINKWREVFGWKFPSYTENEQ